VEVPEVDAACNHDEELNELRQFYDKAMMKQEARWLPQLTKSGNTGFQTVELWDDLYI
jgi:hypothetical protein